MWGRALIAPCAKPGRLLLYCVLLTFTAGCLHTPEVERTRYYSVSPSVGAVQAERTDWTLGIRPMFASRAYGLQMAFLDDSYQIGYRSRDEWAEPPAHVVTRAVADALAATGRFADVGNAADMTRPDLLLTGELRLFHENRTLEPASSEVEVRVELRFSMAPGSLWAETIREFEPMRGNTAAAFAEATNIAVNRLAGRVATSIANIDLPDLQRTPPRPETPRRP